MWPMNSATYVTADCRRAVDATFHSFSNSFNLAWRFLYILSSVGTPSRCTPLAGVPKDIWLSASHWCVSCRCGLSSTPWRLVLGLVCSRPRWDQCQTQTPWSESASEVYRPSDRRLSAKWLPTFADKGCHVVSVTDPYDRTLGFLDRSRYFSIK
jgi:hypothetical protein